MTNENLDLAIHYTNEAMGAIEKLGELEGIQAFTKHAANGAQVDRFDAWSTLYLLRKEFQNAKTPPPCKQKER
jgi:hypothetical protein